MIWKWSISLSVLIIWVLTVRLVGRRRLNRTVIVTLWNLVILRALIPLHIPIMQSPFVLGKWNAIVDKEVMIRETALRISGQPEAKYTDFSRMPQLADLTDCIFAV